jgi:predicted HicB family RNase H-like nuclease
MKKVLLNQYIREDQKAALEAHAQKQGVSMGELVRRALDAYLKLKAGK